MGLVRLVRAGSMQFLASGLRPAPKSSSSSSAAPDQAPRRFADAAAQSGSAWPASEAHVDAAKRLDACLEDLRARSSHGAIPACVCGCPCSHGDGLEHLGPHERSWMYLQRLWS